MHALQPAWSVPGPRWITQLTLNPAAQALGDAYIAAAHHWWATHPEATGAFEQVFRTLPGPQRHVTLTLVERPAAEMSPTEVAQLTDAIRWHIADLAPFEMRLGPALVNTSAIELYLEPDPMLVTLWQRLHEAYRTVFPDEEPEPRHAPFRPHTALGYCLHDFRDDGLQRALLRAPGPVAGYLGPAVSRVEHVVLAPTDAWAPGPLWSSESEIRIPLGHAVEPAR